LDLHPFPTRRSSDLERFRRIGQLGREDRPMSQRESLLIAAFCFVKAPQIAPGVGGSPRVSEVLSHVGRLTKELGGLQQQNLIKLDRKSTRLNSSHVS